jgi:hypothetical protein
MCVQVMKMMEGADITCQSVVVAPAGFVLPVFHVLLLVAVSSITPQLTFTFTTAYSKQFHPSPRKLRPSNIDRLATPLANMASISKPQDPVTLKVKGDHLDNTDSAIETLTTTDLSVTHGATTLRDQAAHQNSDVSAFNVPTETALPATQGLTTREGNAIRPNSNISASTTTTQTDLPSEIWMVVFEHIQKEDNFARPDSVAEYASSLDTHGDSIEAAKTLPPFEKRSWSKTRPLYSINRNSRVAALKLQLCLRVLRTFRKPLVLSECFGNIGFSINIYDLAPVPAHRSVAIEISAQPTASCPVGHWHLASNLIMQNAMGRRYADLIAARHVVLLVSPTASQDAHVDSEWPEGFREMILSLWQRSSILDGTVEIST